MEIWTLGHSHDPYEAIGHRLDEEAIEALVDIRSRPYIQFAHHLDRDRLKQWTEARGHEYRYLGDELGGRPYEDEFYDDEGHTLYDSLARRQEFIDAIAEVEALAREKRTALICLEEEPERCHRFHLVGRVLAQNGIDVSHLRRDAPSETQAGVAQRLGEGQQGLLGSRVWRSPEPMRKGHNVPESD